MFSSMATVGRRDPTLMFPNAGALPIALANHDVAKERCCEGSGSTSRGLEYRPRPALLVKGVGLLVPTRDGTKRYEL
jgi:hypothetical protein